MDLDKYPEMVSGCEMCETYDDTTKDGRQIVKSTCARACRQPADHVAHRDTRAPMTDCV